MIFNVSYQLLHNRSLNRFTLSCLLTMFGNGLTYIIMVWMLMRIDASVTSIAILMTCYWLPNVLFGPLFGVFADRYSGKNLLRSVNGLRAVVVLAFAWYFQTNLSVQSIYALAAITGILQTIYLSTVMTFVRELVDESDLIYANSLVDIAYEIGYILGTGSAGLIMSFLAIPTCFAIDGACYLIAFALLHVKSQPKSNNLKNHSFLEQLKQGCNYITSRPALLLIYLVQTLFFISYMTAPVLLAPYATLVLHANIAQFGLLEAILSIGIIFGSLLSPWLASLYSLTRLIMVYIFIGIIAFCFFSHTTNLNWAIFYHFLLGYSFSAWALITTLLQEMTDLKYQGRVQSLFNSVSGILIIIFYYMFTRWKNWPISTLYSGEVILLIIAAVIMMIFSLYKSKNKAEAHWS